MSEGQAKRYQRIHLFLTLLELALTLGALVVWTAFGLAFRIRDLLLTLLPSVWIQTAVYAMTLSLFLYLVTFALHFYRGYLLENLFSLSTQRLRDWFFREGKQVFLSFLFFLILVEVGYACIRWFPIYWWFWFGLFWFLTSWGLTQFFPTVIVPLFYRYDRLEDPSLTEKLKSFLEQEGCRLEGIWTINFSKETTKANAAMMGLGRAQRMVLSDTLVRNFSPEEIQVIVAHEWGHRKHHHLLKSLLVNGGANLGGFLCLSKILRGFLVPPHYQNLADPAGLSIFLLMFTLYGLLFLPVQNGLSRFFEWEADAYALRVTQARQAFISAMQKLAQKNLSEISPNPWIEFLFYDHPSIGRRIAFAEKF